MTATTPEFLTIARPAGGEPWRIACRARAAQGEGASRAGFVWLGGFASDMRGEKASFIDAKAEAEWRAMLRFDYSGHGESAFDAPPGRFVDGCVGDWMEQSFCVFMAKTQGPQILIGSSMGAWIALLLARRLAEKGLEGRLRGLLLLAPAPDFTEALLWKSLSPAARREIMDCGVHLRLSPYGATPLTRRLIEDGRSHLLLGGLVRTHAPTHIVHGSRDADVPLAHALALVDRICADPVTFTLAPEGDHRLSRPEDLALIARALDGLD